MLKKLLLTVVALGFSISGVASTVTKIQDVEYKVDTLRHIKVGPGVMYSSLYFQSLSTTKKFYGYVLTMDMKNNENVEYKMEIGNDTTLTTERISSIAKRKTDSDTHYFAGVNADFFITTSYVPEYAGQPHMDCIMNGEVASTGYLDAANYGHFFMDYDNNMWCDNPTQSFVVTFPDNSVTNLARINQDIYENEMVLFNSKFGKQTRMDGCTEVQVQLAEGYEWGVNKDLKLVVTSAPVTTGSVKINQGEAVLSGKGTAAEKIALLKEGDELTLRINLSLQDYGVTPDVKECSGGDVVILKRGEVIYEAHRFINARDGNNPRTMFGYPEDRSKMVWCAIDGRSGISDGCTYPEGADVMRFLGCYDALNLDGGGSTGMYVAPFGIVNRPSDGTERAVANGIFAVLNAPDDNEIAEIRFVDHSVFLPKYGYYTPVFYGYNKYGLLIDTDVKGVTLSAPAALGEIVDNGVALLASGDGTHALTANLGNITATVAVTVTEGDLSTKYASIIEDGYHGYFPEVISTVNGVPYPVAPQALTWWVDDSSVATVDASGKILGVKNGTTTVSGRLNSFETSLNVTVEKPESRHMAIEENTDPTTWTFSQTGGTITETTSLPTGLAIKYTGKGGRSPYLKMSKDIQLYSIPDSVKITINPNQAPVNAVTIMLATAQGESLTYKVDASELQPGVDNVILIAVDDVIDASQRGNYPITFKYLNFGMGTSTTGQEYEIVISKLETVYTAIPQSGVELVENDFQSIKVYPNPATAGDIVTIDVADASCLAVYDNSGRLVRSMKLSQGKSSLSTEGLVPGVYRLTVSGKKAQNTVSIIIK